jgi:hypothetical protein
MDVKTFMKGLGGYIVNREKDEKNTPVEHPNTFVQWLNRRECSSEHAMIYTKLMTPPTS